MSNDSGAPSPQAKLGSLLELAGSTVVIDTDTSHVFIGTLEAAGEAFLTLDDADVHNMNDSSLTKEVYTLEALKYGVRANRKRVFLRTERVICVSRMEDVIRY